uniref:Uncharacterized protein n=1 Tax=Arundo donax TaxID=35708 RepID=A0A0A9FUN9_ARUDO
MTLDPHGKPQPRPRKTRIFLQAYTYPHASSSWSTDIVEQQKRFS